MHYAVIKYTVANSWQDFRPVRPKNSAAEEIIRPPLIFPFLKAFSLCERGKYISWTFQELERIRRVNNLFKSYAPFRPFLYRNRPKIRSLICTSAPLFIRAPFTCGRIIVQLATLVSIVFTLSREFFLLSYCRIDNNQYFEINHIQKKFIFKICPR